MYAIDLSNRLNSVNIFHVNIINWDVVHVKLWPKMYLHRDFVANLIFAKLNKLLNVTIPGQNLRNLLKSQNPYFWTKFQKLMFHAHEIHAHEIRALKIHTYKSYAYASSTRP
jgi:hypothetical protein